jgi:Chitin binding Peritrophin-A domain
MRIIFVIFSLFIAPVFSFVTKFNDPCENIINGYAPYENNCNYFIYCVNGVGSIERCPIGQIFDLEELRCMPGNPETCELFTTTTTTVAPPMECPLIDDFLNPVFFPHPCNFY